MMLRRDSGIWFYATLVLLGIVLLSHTRSYNSGLLNVQQRFARSEVIWQESVRRREEALGWFPDRNNITFFPSADKSTYYKYGLSVWDFVAPTWTCPWDLQRVGRIGDGGKWVCGMSKFVENKKRPCVIYSFGVRDESTFEEEMIQRTNCHVFAYDPAVDKIVPPQMSAEALKRVQFTKAAVGGKNVLAANPPTWTLKHIMEMNGHDYIDILKMDIEYHEFATMQKFLEDFNGQAPIGQFMVEIHLFSKGRKITIDKTNVFLNWWEKLEAAGLRATMFEPNVIFVTLKLEDGMPRLSEYTFVNAKDERSLLRIE